ncbi:type II secretion system F family protein [Synechococcus sp. UW140]|uniref:type II secretion system F family protein n=1 Tax=Synechococcus sp. UW140 TaxID=368503 RepID=UPI003137C2DC
MPTYRPSGAPNPQSSVPLNVAAETSSLWASLTSKQPSPRHLTIPGGDLMVFFRQLAVILQSGVPLAQGLLLLGDNMTNPRLAHCVNQIATQLNSGEELSFCLRQYPKVFKPITIGLIEAGELGGILETVLDRISLLMEQQAKLKGQMIGALVYPVIVLVIALGVGLGLLIGIVPRFAVMFKDLGAELPAITKFMLGLSGFVTSPTAALGTPLVIFGGLSLLKSTYGTPQGRLEIDRLLLKLPLFGSLLLRYEMASMCETLSTLVNSGIPVVDGMERCVTASSNQVIKNAISDAISLARQGQPLSNSLAHRQVMPKLVIAMVRIGEETGELSFMLEKLAVFYTREIESAVSALTKAMEPAVVLVVAVIVGTIVISLYLPMFDLIKAFKQ